MEHEPDEFIVDPWVAERLTLVAERRGRVVAAAHLLRYSGDESVGPDYRNAGDIRWLVYGVPDCWPHVRAIYDALGFVPDRQEILLMAATADLPEPGAGDGMRRTLGINGTRLTAPGDTGYIEIDTARDRTQRLSGDPGLADIGNLEVRPEHRRQGVGRRLLGAAAGWASLSGNDRVLASADPADSDLLGFLRATGFLDLTVTSLGFRIVAVGPEQLRTPS